LAKAVVGPEKSIDTMRSARALPLDFADGRLSIILNQSARGQSAALPSPPAL